MKWMMIAGILVIGAIFMSIMTPMFPNFPADRLLPGIPGELNYGFLIMEGMLFTALLIVVVGLAKSR